METDILLLVFAIRVSFSDHFLDDNPTHLQPLFTGKLPFPVYFDIINLFLVFWILGFYLFRRQTGLQAQASGLSDDLSSCHKFL